MSAKLTQSKVNALKVDPAREQFVWDAELRGFGVRVKPSGAMSYLVQYRNTDGRTRRLTLGSAKVLKLELARKQAMVKLAEVASGLDPSKARGRGKTLTVADLCTEYLKDAKSGKIMSRGKPKSPSTLATDEGRIARHIVPLLGSKSAEKLKRSDVVKFLQDVTAGKTAVDEKTGFRGRARVTGGAGTATKSVSILSAVFSYAIDHGLVEANPCHGVKLPPSKKKDRFLSEAEYRALGMAASTFLRQGRLDAATRAIVAMALTGCRKGEILDLRKGYVDMTGHALRFPVTKTGKQDRPCGQAALDWLEQSMPDTGEYVFPSNLNDGPIVNIRKPLLALCQEAGLEEVTPHVFRHSYASVAHELGYSELTISGLLGHAGGTVTARYVHHVDRVLVEAADKVAQEIWRRMAVQALRKVC